MKDKKMGKLQIKFTQQSLHSDLSIVLQSYEVIFNVKISVSQNFHFVAYQNLVQYLIMRHTGYL